MGLFNDFGKGLSGLFGEGFADRAAIASALLEGDGASAAKIKQAQAERKADEQKAQMQQAAMLHAYQGFKAMGMSDDQAITLAANPAAAASFIADRNKGQQYSASGGSYYDPVTGQTRMAPSRHEFQGSVFDVGGGAPGQQAQVTPQHQGVQWVTPQPGTTAFGVNSFTGAPMGGDAPHGNAPIPVTSKAEYDALPPGSEYIAPDGSHRVKGGQAGQSSPAGFSGF
jgi:hypothetical protein